MTLDLLQELDNQAGIQFQNMSPEARTFLYNNHASGIQENGLPAASETTFRGTNCYRHTIVDELENKDRISFREMSKLAREILSGPLFQHVETCTKFRAWTPATALGIMRTDMLNNAYRLILPGKSNPTWVDIAPHLSSSNLWMLQTPDDDDDAGILITSAPAHANFLGFVYGEHVYKRLRYNSSAESPVIIPDAVRFRAT